MTVSGTATSCNASGYWVGAVSTTGDSVTITPTVPGTYSESVQCSNGAGLGNMATVSIAVTPLPPSSGGVIPDIDPAAPGVQQRHGDTSTATWNDVAGATSYNVYVVPSGGGTSICAAGCPLAQSAVCSGGACVTTGPNHVGYSAGNFTVYVTACNASGCSGPSPTVSVTVQSNNAAFMSQKINNQPNPTSVNIPPGQSTFPVELIFENRGDATWDDPGGYVLRSKNLDGNTTWGSSEVRLVPSVADPTTVLKNQQVKFSGPVPTPVPGTYNFQWQMYRKTNTYGYFGVPSTNVSITVSGQTQAVPIKVKLQIKARQHLPLQ